MSFLPTQRRFSTKVELHKTQQGKQRVCDSEIRHFKVILYTANRYGRCMCLVRILRKPCIRTHILWSCNCPKPIEGDTIISDIIFHHTGYTKEAVFN